MWTTPQPAPSRHLIVHRPRPPLTVHRVSKRPRTNTRPMGQSLHPTEKASPRGRRRQRRRGWEREEAREGPPTAKTPTGPRCQAAWEHGEIVGVAGGLAMQEPVLDFMQRRPVHAAGGTQVPLSPEGIFFSHVLIESKLQPSGARRKSENPVGGSWCHPTGRDVWPTCAREVCWRLREGDDGMPRRNAGVAVGRRWARSGGGGWEDGGSPGTGPRTDTGSATHPGMRG